MKHFPRHKEISRRNILAQEKKTGNWAGPTETGDIDNILEGTEARWVDDISNQILASFSMVVWDV